MANIDYSRKFDLEELSEAIEKSRTAGERDYYKRIMYSILKDSENEDLFYWRNELMKAINTNSKERKLYCIRQIQYIKQNESGGKFWGSNKGNRNVN